MNVPPMSTATRVAIRRKSGDGRRVLVDAQVVAQHDAVVALGTLAGDVPVEHVLAHPLGVALERVPESAAAARPQLPARSGSERQGVHLQQMPLVGPSGFDDDVGPDGVAAAEQAPARRHRALEPEVEARLGSTSCRR